MMKLIFSLIFLLLNFNEVYAMPLPLDTVFSVKNTDSTYVNRGICSITLDLEANENLNNINKLVIYYSLIKKTGSVIEKDVTETDEISIVGGRTYARFFIESEKACSAFGETINISKLIVYFNDGSRPLDIVKSKNLKSSNFKPMKISISNGN